MKALLFAAILICLSTNLLASPTIFRPPEVDVSACVASQPNNTLGWSYGWNGTCGCTTEGIERFAARRSVDGDTMIMASPNSPRACTGSGSIFVYKKTGSEWLLDTELLSPLRVPFDGFPGKVIIKDDTIVARQNNTFGASPTVIFRFNGTEWLEHQTILADSVDEGDVTWNFDGTTISILEHVTEDIYPRVRVYTPSADGLWRQSSELTFGRDLDASRVRGGNHMLSGDTLVTQAFEVSVSGIDRSLIQVFHKGDRGWVEEARFFDVASTSNGQGAFDPAPAVSRDEIIFRSFRIARGSSGSWRLFSIENDFPPIVPQTTVSYNLSPNGNILITHQDPFEGFSNSNSTNEIRTYLLSDNDRWELVDEIIEPDATGLDTPFMVNDGSTLLLRERVRTESSDLEVRVFAYSFDENGNFINANQAENMSEACDYSSADLFDGWGWNPATRMSCPPVVEEINQVESQQDACDYSNAGNFGGWGWNNTTMESCPPLTGNSSMLNVATDNQTNSCVDSDGDGWGWDGVSSCQVAPVTSGAASSDCIDSDGDGWGWDGTSSCRVEQ